MLGASMIILIGTNTFTQQSHDETISADVSKQLKGYIDIFIHINSNHHHHDNHRRDNQDQHHDNHHHDNQDQHHDNQDQHHDNQDQHHQSQSSRICVGQYYSNSTSSSMSIPLVDFQYDNDEVRVVQISKLKDQMSVFSDVISNFGTGFVSKS